jgi:ABC-type nickel/cobalt efflux system permease component RcnA
MLIGVMLAPALSVMKMTLIADCWGRRAAVAGILAAVAVAWLVAIVGTGTGVDIGAPLAAIEGSARIVAFIAVAILVALALRTIWRSGAGAWIHALGIHDHGHAHEGGHEHVYGDLHGAGHRHHFEVEQPPNDRENDKHGQDSDPR